MFKMRGLKTQTTPPASDLCLALLISSKIGDLWRTRVARRSIVEQNLDLSEIPGVMFDDPCKQSALDIQSIGTQSGVYVYESQRDEI